MRLEIVVAPDCVGCAEARAIAEEIQGRFASVEVHLLELGGDRPIPKQVVATPTYLLDGAVISLGNPRMETLMRLIRRRMND